MQQDAIDVFCLSHGVSFQAPRSNRVIICRENHALSANFPNSGRWFYCCLCHKYWVAPEGEGGDAFPRQCPSCKLIKKAHYYSCAQCNVTMIDSQGAGNREGAHITPWGTPHPHCPGCRQLPKSIPQSHMCPELNGLLTTARGQCPFCEGQERADNVGDRTDLRSLPATAMDETAIIRVGSSNDSAGLDPADLDLEEPEKNGSVIRELEAEAEAREAKAQEKLRQVEARLRQEMSRRLELERKTQEIVLELKNRQEIDQNRIAQDHVEAVRITSEAAARFEEERDKRVAAEQAKAEAETKLSKMEARLIETDERLRQANAKLQQEGLKLTQAQERADELEVQLVAEAAKSRAEAEGKIQEIRAEARRVEENYRVEINRFRGEQEMALKAAGEAEENHKTEIARITADAESRTQQAEAAIRQQCQIKVDEAIASAQDAMFNLEETRKKLDVAEARRQGMDGRARQAETQLRQINLIQRMNSALIGQVIEGSLKTSGKNGPESLPFDLRAEVNEILNALFLPEDLSVPEGLRDLPDDSGGPTMSGDDHRRVDITDSASPPDESAQSPPQWGLD